MNPFRTVLIPSLFVYQAHCQDSLLEASFDGLANDSNNVFEILTNSQANGSGGSWNQATGVVNRGSTNSSTSGAVSASTIDIPALATTSTPLILTVEVESLTGTLGANGLFIGFQDAPGGPNLGGNLWNNQAPSFGLVIDGSNRLGNRVVAPGGNSSLGGFQDSPAFGTTTLDALNDGFTLTLVIDNIGWQFIIDGLESSTGTDIIGSSGSWADLSFDFEDFSNSMRVGFTTQGNNGSTLDLARINVSLDSDSDGDGLPDSYEDANGTDRTNPNDAAFDNDNDNLTNLQEFLANTDPQNADTDNDNLNDGSEVNGTLNPWTNRVFGSPPGDPTNPLLADTDGDGDNDGLEITNSTDPNNFPPNTGPLFPFLDTDGDSFSDIAENAFGSDPNDASNIPDHTPAAERPNIVLIYADDLGLADMSAYGDIFGAIPPARTPNMDALATEGTLFTQAHSANGVCTPSRYSILTGKYNWREFNDISRNYGFTNQISELPRASDVTIAEFLKTQSYFTAAFGKWHLGGSWFAPGTNNRIITNPSDPGDVDWGRPVEDHAVSHGFDLFRGLAASINFGPYVYLENDRNQIFDASLNNGEGGYRDATNNDNLEFLSTNFLNSTIINGARRDSRASLGDPTYRQVEAGPIMIAQVEEFIAEQADSNVPFFTYVSLYSPHEPYALTEEFIGPDSERGFFYADWMREVDDRIGRVIDAIDQNGLRDNTIVILTSDNGTENTAMEQSLAFGADPNGPLRGNKRDAWEGGTRVPFVIRWPGQAAEGQIISDPIWQGDLFATIAAYLGVELPNDTAPDGESFLNLIRGQQKPLPRRDSIVVSSLRGDLGLKTIAGWKLIDATGGGDRNSWDSSNNRLADPTGINRGNPKQLFNLSADIGEDDNLIANIATDDEIRDELTAITGIDLLASLDTLRANSTTEVFPRIPDNDADSLPNSFELLFGLNPDSPIDASLDLDGDGATNLDEFIAGTSPSDADDLLRIIDLESTATDFTITWTSVPERTYTLLRSTDLQVWVTDSVHTATSDTESATLTRAASGEAESNRLFVRVSVDAPAQ